MKFGQSPTIRDMAKVVDARLGRTTGESKGKAPLPKVKIKPTGGLKNPGVKAVWKF